MFENIKYEDLKNLPDDQKKEALVELMTIHGSNKAIAEAVGAKAPVTISNMYNKYVEGKSVGRVKGSKNKVQESKPEEIKTETIQEPQQEQQPEKAKRKYNRKAKPDKVIDSPKHDLYEEVKSALKELDNTPNKTVEQDAFSIVIKKTVSGEDAQLLLNGIGNTLLKYQQYSVEIRITEK